MIWLEDIKHMIFISSPRISSLTELMEMNVFLSDIPLYDVTRELVLLNQQRIAEIDVAYVFILYKCWSYFFFGIFHSHTNKKNHCTCKPG